MDDKSPENEQTEFLLTMNNEIKKCLESYDREIFVKFQAKARLIPDVTSYTQIDAHNLFIFRKIHSLSDTRSIMRALIFILYSPNLSISDLFHALTRLTPKVHPDMFFYKVVVWIHNILMKDLSLLEQFSKKLTPETARWVHFCIIGKSLSTLPLNDIASVMKSFHVVSLSFSNREFSAVSKFIKGITLPIFDAFLKPFLDRQMLRNAESFINILPFYLKPLKFCRIKTVPHHGIDYIEAVAQACESSNEKLAQKAMSIVEIFADHISPQIFPFNSLSIIPFFKCVPICRSSVDVAFSQLQKNHALSQNARNALLSFLTRSACQKEPLFNVNEFIQKYLLDPPQYLFLFLIIKAPGIDTKPIIEAISNSNNLLCLSIRSILGTYKLKEADLTSTFVPQIFKGYSFDEVKAYSEILFNVRNSLPDFSSRSFVLCTIVKNHQEIILDAFHRAISDCSDEFKNGFFNSTRFRFANELKVFIPTLIEYVSTFDAQQFVICIALNNKFNAILDDNTNINNNININININNTNNNNSNNSNNNNNNNGNDDSDDISHDGNNNMNNCFSKKSATNNGDADRKFKLLKLDENIVVDGLFNLLKGEWKKGAEGALIQLCSHKNCHRVIAKRLSSMLDDLELLSDNVDILSNLMLHFDIESDREIFDTVFFNTPRSKISDGIIIHCLSANSRYVQFPSILCSLLRCSKDGGEGFTRNFIFSMMPKHNITAFDFLLFLPFYKHLLKTNDYDNICEQVGDFLCQFDWIPFSKSDIIDALEDFDESDQVLAHLCAIDELKDITDFQIARRITKRSTFANYFKKEMDKYGKKFYTDLMIAALTTHNIYVEPLPPFKKYFNYMISFNLDNEHAIESISSTIYYYYRKIINDVVDCVLESDKIKPVDFILGVLAKLTSIGNRSQQVFSFLMNLKKSQINPKYFNEIVQLFLLPEFSDKIIERFLSQPEFNALPYETLPSLYNALKTSSKSVPELFELIKSQCKPRISDQTVGILIECMLIIRQNGSSSLTEISNKMLMNYETTKGEYLGLVFHFSNHPNKIKMLEQWITSNNMRSKALMVLRYLFSFPSEKNNLHTFLNNLISLTTSTDSKIAESAANALRLAASSLSASMESEITPFIISTIQPETSRFELEADLQFLIQVEKKNSLILLPFLPQFFLALKNIKNRNNSIDELCLTIEDHLIHADVKKASLYIDIVRMIRNNSNSLEIYEKIDEKIEDTKKDETLTNIAFSMIEADLSNTDLRIKLITFKILSQLDLNQQLFEKSESIFYGLSTDPHRKEIVPHFMTFLDNCSFERKEHIFQFFLDQANKDIKNFQASGFSLLYGTILAKLNDDSHVSNIIEMILNTSNGMVRESLMTSLTEMLEVNKELSNKHITEIASCFLSITNSDINSFKLLSRITAYLSPEVLSDFMVIVISFMNSSVPEVRETCFSLFLLLMRNLHPFDNFSSLDIKEKKIYYDLYAATICNYYDYISSVREKADHLLLLLNNNFKIDEKDLVDSILPCLNSFLTNTDEKVRLLGIYGISHIMSFVLNDQQLMDKIVLSWINISESQFPLQINQCLVEVLPDELRPEISKTIVNLDQASSLMTPTTAYSILYTFIDSRKYLYLIPIAYKNWPTQTSSFIDQVLDNLYKITHGEDVVGSFQPVKKPDNLPSQFRFGVTDKNKVKSKSKPNSALDKELEIKKCTEPFINLSVLLANEKVVDFIKKFKNTDNVMIQLIGRMAEVKPEFFTQCAETYAESVFPIFFASGARDKIMIIEESILQIIMNIKPMEAGSFFRKISPTFLKLSPVNHLPTRSRNILSDQFVSTLIDSVFKLSGTSNEMFPDFAFFLSSIFKFISDEIRNQKADILIKKFISVIVKNENETSSILSSGAADLMCAMRLFSTFIVNNTEILIISEISACLAISRMTPPIQSELISMIECAMSMSVSNLLLLRLLQEKVSSSPIVPVFECISFIIEFSDTPFDDKVLLNVWNTIASSIKSESQQVRIRVAKIASLIVQLISGKSKDEIMDQVLMNNPNDAAIYCSFLIPLKSLDVLHDKHIENIKRLLSIADPNSCMFLTLIPKLAYGFDISSSSNEAPSASERSSRRFSSLGGNAASLPKQFSHPHIGLASFSQRTLNIDACSSQPSTLISNYNPASSFFNIGLLAEAMNYLVRGVKGRISKSSGLGSSYIVPLICLQTIGELQEALRDVLDIKESTVIVSGLYLASCGLQGYLKEYAFYLLGEILEKGQESPFREKYFKAIDSSLAQAFQRDILSTN